MGRDGGALFLRQTIQSVRHYWLMPRDAQAPAKKRANPGRPPFRKSKKKSKKASLG
jgi:hypothetical protein